MPFVIENCLVLVRNFANKLLLNKIQSNSFYINMLYSLSILKKISIMR